ncbi:MAG: PRC-barrel domain-containing protein [Rhodospirillales bacterium]
MILLGFSKSANAEDLKVTGYSSPAAVLVTMEPLADLSSRVPMDSFSTAPPSKALLIGKAAMAKRHQLPPHNIVGKDVTNIAGDAIGVVTKIDGEQVIVAVEEYFGAGARHIALDWNHFTTSGVGKNIKLLMTLSKFQLKKLPKYNS